MENHSLQPDLLTFFKALADENRLKIIGLLAQKSYTVERLADELGLGVSTVSHHLSRLAKAGLVRARVDGHYYEYSLQLDRLQEVARQLLHRENLPALSAGVPADAFEQKVMKAFVDSDGRVKSFPKQEKKYLVLLKYVLRAFEPGRRYSENEVNEILSRFNDDTAMLRRSFIEYRLMAREGGGGAYWRTDEDASQPSEENVA